ncbi:hypothetical protein EUGRSUZ_C03065 [Eucalyptus grandis]|uniref:Uncharacterized protein n=2 Tax=Eucalyptus grandis TaxID=71139 RepID=A0ACC3LHM9_EUCGR|nr:hypothetical protein EUGRSUZ_C03065 [Eucalyptus grandis]
MEIRRKVPIFFLAKYKPKKKVRFTFCKLANGAHDFDTTEEVILFLLDCQPGSLIELHVLGKEEKKSILL